MQLGFLHFIKWLKKLFIECNYINNKICFVDNGLTSMHKIQFFISF